MNTLRILIRLGLSLVFAWAAIGKIMDPRAFLDAVNSYHLLAAPAAAIVAVWLPCLELTLAIALWSGKFSRSAACMLALLCVVFLGALLQAWLRGINVTCGCFGDPSVVQGIGYLGYLGRDVFLAGSAIALWEMERRTAPVHFGAVHNP